MAMVLSSAGMTAATPDRRFKEQVSAWYNSAGRPGLETSYVSRLAGESYPPGSLVDIELTSTFSLVSGGVYSATAKILDASTGSQTTTSPTTATVFDATGFNLVAVVGSKGKAIERVVGTTRRLELVSLSAGFGPVFITNFDQSGETPITSTASKVPVDTIAVSRGVAFLFASNEITMNDSGVVEVEADVSVYSQAVISGLPIISFFLTKNDVEIPGTRRWMTVPGLGKQSISIGYSGDAVVGDRFSINTVHENSSISSAEMNTISSGSTIKVRFF